MINLRAEYGLTYRASDHRYERFGQKVFSVTGVLPYVSNEWLDKNPSVLAKAADRGHRVAEFIEAAEKAPMEGAVLPMVGIPRSEKLSETPELAYLKFKKETGFVALASPAGDIGSELFVYHDLLDYCGRLDLIGRCENLKNEVTVIDVKATAIIPKTVGPQTSGYFEAYNRNAKLYGWPKARKRAVLHLKPTGYVYQVLDNPRDFSNFCACLTATRFAAELGLELQWSLPGVVAPSPEEVFV